MFFSGDMACCFLKNNRRTRWINQLWMKYPPSSPPFPPPPPPIQPRISRAPWKLSNKTPSFFDWRIHHQRPPVLNRRLNPAIRIKKYIFNSFAGMNPAERIHFCLLESRMKCGEREGELFILLTLHLITCCSIFTLDGALKCSTLRQWILHTHTHAQLRK